MNMSDHYLPPEIVLEILQRLPVKSLVKFTSVCRAWNSLITNQTFIYDHLNNKSMQASQGHNNSLFFQFSVARDIGQLLPLREHLCSLYSANQQTGHHFSVERFPLSNLFPPDRHTWFGGTCNGLVCSAYYSSPSSSSTIILIWNPLLRKYVVLPEPIMTCNKQDHCKSFGLGFDSRNNDYKVVLLMKVLSGQHPDHLEVYSLVSRSWRSITIRVPKFFFDFVNFGSAPVLVNGAMHWVVCRKKDGSVQRSILSFDVTEETFGGLTLPPYVKSNEESIATSALLVVEGGRSLAVVNRQLIRERTEYELLNIWVMKEYGITDSWTEIFHCDQRDYGGILDILALTSNGKVVLRCFGGAIVLVDPTKELMEPIGNQESLRAFAGSYVESLLLINKEPDVLSF